MLNNGWIFVVAVALCVAMVMVIMVLIAIIVFQRWRISDSNVHLEKFITENMELREKIRRVEAL